MAKSRRSNVKMAHRAMRRRILQPKLDEKLREQAGKVYGAIGLPLPPPTESAQPYTRSHNGSEIVSTFVPTPKGPELNKVHGPLANRSDVNEGAELVGFPIVGAGMRAKRMSAVAQRVEEDERVIGMDTEGDGDLDPNEPYFYPRHDLKKFVKKRRRGKKNTAKEALRMAAQMEVESLVSKGLCDTEGQNHATTKKTNRQRRRKPKFTVAGMLDRATM